MRVVWTRVVPVEVVRTVRPQLCLEGRADGICYVQATGMRERGVKDKPGLWPERWS